MKKIPLFLLLFFCINTNVFAGKNFNKVLYIVFENTEFSQAIVQPYFKQLINEGALLTNFHAAIHPSQGNYVAMITGSSFNINHDDLITLNKPHIGDLLEKEKKDWRMYAEDYPGNCFIGMRSLNYVRKHNPFILFSNIQNNPLRCKKIVNSRNFFIDLNNNKLKEFSMFIPNLKNDGHDTGVAFADRWFKNTFDDTLHSKTFPRDLLVIITFDEGLTKTNHIYTLLFGANTKKGSTSSRPYNFSSLLNMIKYEFGISHTSEINDVWN